MKIFSATHDFDYAWDEVSTANWRKYCPWNHESQHVIAVDTLSRSLDQQTGILRTERLITCKQSAPRWLLPFVGASDVSYVYEVSYVTPPARAQLQASLAAATPTPPPMPTDSLTKSSASSHKPNRPFTRQPSSASTSKDGSSASAPISASQDKPNFVTPPTDPLPKIIPVSQPPRVVMTSQNLTWSDLLSVRETVVYQPHPTHPLTKTQFKQHAEVTALCGGWQKVREKIEGFTVERFGQNAEKGKRGFEEVLAMSRKVFREEKAKEKVAAAA